MGLLPMILDILPPSDERIFKLLLTSPAGKPALLGLISAIIGRCVADAAILNNDATEKKSDKLGVNCRLSDGTLIDLKIQSSHIQEDLDGNHRNLKSKSIYNLCELHSSQSPRGLRRFEKLAQTYHVTFCDYTVFPKLPNYVNSFSMRHDTAKDMLSDAIHVIYVELSKISELLKKPVSDMTVLEKWSVFIQYASISDYRETVNEIIMSNEALQIAGDLLLAISKDECERAKYRSRQMCQTDLKSDIATAEDRGEKIKALRIAQNMLKRNRPIAEIVEDTGLTFEEVQRLCQ